MISQLTTLMLTNPFIGQMAPQEEISRPNYHVFRFCGGG